MNHIIRQMKQTFETCQITSEQKISLFKDPDRLNDHSWNMQTDTEHLFLVKSSLCCSSLSTPELTPHSFTMTERQEVTDHNNTEAVH